MASLSFKRSVYTLNSNAIEGNTLTLKETAMVLEGMTIDRKPLKEINVKFADRKRYYDAFDVFYRDIINFV